MDERTKNADAPQNSNGESGALVAEAKDVAGQLASEAKQAVGKLAEEAKAELEKRATSSKDGAAKTVGEVAGMLRHGVEDLDGRGPLPKLADQAADRIEQVAEYVQTRTIGDLVREAERFARREPALFLGGSFALGVLAGRFLKSDGARASGDAMRIADDTRGRPGERERTASSAREPSPRAASTPKPKNGGAERSAGRP